MTTSTLTLTDFLLARIAEDEAAVEGATYWEPVYSPTATIELTHDALTIAPSRVLAECEAKRRIVELHPPRKRRDWDECAVCFDPDTAPGDYDFEWWPCATLCALALPYADHPDYRDEWRP